MAISSIDTSHKNQHTIACIGLKKGRIGISIYLHEERTLCFGEYWETISSDIRNPELSHYATLMILLIHYNPCEILISSQCDAKLVSFLNYHKDSTLKSSLCDNCKECVIKSISLQLFSFEDACIRLRSLSLPIYRCGSENNENTERIEMQKLGYLHTMINFEYVIMVRTTGALLAYILENIGLFSKKKNNITNGDNISSTDSKNDETNDSLANKSHNESDDMNKKTIIEIDKHLNEDNLNSFEKRDIYRGSEDNHPRYRKLMNATCGISENFGLEKVSQRTESVTILEKNLLPTETSRLFIQNIKGLDLEDRLVVDRHVLDYLQIIYFDRHPSVHGIGCSKEGLDLLSILNQCKSALGKSKMKNWVLTPKRDPKSINIRLGYVEFIITHFPDSLIKEIWQYLKHVHDIPRIFTKLKLLEGEVGDWTRLRDSLVNLIQIYSIMRREFSTSTPLILPISNILQVEWEKVEDTTIIISKTIDFENSVLENRVVIKKGINQDLDEYKKILESLDSFLDSIAEEEINKFNSDLQSLRVLYIPQMGFQVAIPLNEDQDVSKIMKMSRDHPELEMEFQFATSSYIYWKTKTAKELDEFLGDIKSNLIDIELSIANETVLKIFEYHSIFIQLCEYISELDCLLSFANISKERSYTRPIILDTKTKPTRDNGSINETDEIVKLNYSDGDQIVVRNGRHPLMESILASENHFIPNDIIMKCSENGMVQLLTGPNNSGKSIYLKQCGLICYMAHLGCFVPADSAILTPVDRIFTLNSFPDTQIIENNFDSVVRTKGKGHFLSSLLIVGTILQYCTQHSLILLDEFGRETTETDGSALLHGIINFLTSNADPEKNIFMCPRTLIITHLNIANSPLLNRVEKVFKCLHTRVLLPNQLSELERNTLGNKIRKKSNAQPLITNYLVDKNTEKIKENENRSSLSDSQIKSNSIEENCNKEKNENDIVQLLDSLEDTINDPVFLYKIDIGPFESLSDQSNSFGIYCAQAAGLDQFIVQRAKEIYKKNQLFQKIEPLPLESDQENFEKLISRSTESEKYQENALDTIIEKIVKFDKEDTIPVKSFISGLFENLRYNFEQA